MDPLKTDEEQSVKKHLSRPPAPFLSLQTVAKILEVIQPPGSHLNSFGVWASMPSVRVMQFSLEFPLLWAPRFWGFFGGFFPFFISY